MKKYLLTTLVLAMAVSFMFGQIQTPQPSPVAKIEQRIGLIDVTLEYSRPSMKGRKIFGDLVPYGEVWRTGANAATKITFSEDVTIEGNMVKKGAYALLTKPGEKSWTIMLYPHTSTNFGSYLNTDVQPIAFEAKVNTMPEGVSVETFTMNFDNLTNHGGSLYLLWDKTYVSFNIEVQTDKAVEASIARVMAGPSAGDYSSAAMYYYSEKKDLNKALEWINKSIEMGNDRFWILRTKSLIQADLGDKKGAIETAMKSLEMARKENNADYVRMNEASIAEWKK